MIQSPAELLEIKRACIKQVEFYILLAEKKLQVSLEIPNIRFSISGRVAGRAWCDKNLIEFNPTIIKLNPQEFLARTPGHEVAHLIAYKLHGLVAPHGKEWARVMWAFSLPAVRCHNYQISEKEPRKKTVIPYKTSDSIVRSIQVGKIIEFD